MGYTQDGVGFQNTETSEEAARNLSGSMLKRLRFAILMDLRANPGSTALQIEQRLLADFPGQKLFHSRVGELRTNFGWTRRGNRTTNGSTGQPAWELFLTDAGEQAIHDLGQELGALVA